MGQVRSIVIDTLTAIQEIDYMVETRKVSRDKWRDYSQDIYTLIQSLSYMGFEMILILGDPGTGKSYGMKTLPEKTNIWFNADNKNPTWIGGIKVYGTKVNPTPNYHVIPRSYSDIIKHLDHAAKAGAFEERRFAFLLGHVATYKGAQDVTKERLKVLGSLATNMQIEGKFENTFYSNIRIEDGKREFFLETQNSGYNTARSTEGAFPEKIPNDYNYIIQTLLNHN